MTLDQETRQNDNIIVDEIHLLDEPFSIFMYFRSID